MKLTSLTIEEFRQFKDFRLDFTDPATGKPLEKVCFIGPNGTGKSTLLALVADACCGSDPRWQGLPTTEGERAHFNFLEGPGEGFEIAHLGPLPVGFRGEKMTRWTNPVRIRDLLMVYCPPEGEGSGKHADPIAGKLDAALGLIHETRCQHRITAGTTDKFWIRVVAHLKLREKEYLELQRQPQNRNRTIAEIEEEFDQTHPQVLEKLAEVWNRILCLADLEFDRESVEIPVQLNDSLKAFVRTKSGKKHIGYSSLSTGIRHYLFRLGHIWSLYFNRPPGDSLLLVDEPEGSLYPDFLYDIVENYREVAPGCQLFMTTHSPIVAAQFKPEERFILTFGDDGYVTAHRGMNPEGDDPNDMLDKDFGVRNLMPAAGQRKWEEFLELRRRILVAPPEERLPLVEKSAKIGLEYNFPLNGA